MMISLVVFLFVKAVPLFFGSSEEESMEKGASEEDRK